MRTFPAALVAVLFALLVPASPATAQSDTSLADLEDEVMCPVCGTMLGLADAPQAQRQKAMISRMVEDGHSKQEIKDELVAEFGPQVLALPEDSGFSLTAYLVPIAGFLIALAALSLAVVRWRRAADAAPVGTFGSGGESETEGQRAEDDLDQDIARYEL